jgi:hypothetical protein
MTKPALERLATALLLLMVLVDGVLTAVALAERQRLQSATAHMTREGVRGPTPEPDGFDRSGAPIDFVPGSTGLAVRYASGMCPYCRRDNGWDILAPALRKRGFQVIVLLVTAKDEFTKDAVVPQGAPQVAYVSMEWIKRFRLVATPTLLLFDASRRLIWHHEGQLGLADTKNAVRAVDAATSRR